MPERRGWKRRLRVGLTGSVPRESSISSQLVARPRRERIESRIFADFRRASFAHGFSRAAGTAQYTAWQPGPQAPPVEGTVVRGCVPVRTHTPLCVCFERENVYPCCFFPDAFAFPSCAFHWPLSQTTVTTCLACLTTNNFHPTRRTYRKSWLRKIVSTRSWTLDSSINKRNRRETVWKLGITCETHTASSSWSPTLGCSPWPVICLPEDGTTSTSLLSDKRDSTDRSLFISQLIAAGWQSGSMLPRCSRGRSRVLVSQPGRPMDLAFRQQSEHRLWTLARGCCLLLLLLAPICGAPTRRVCVCRVTRKMYDATRRPSSWYRCIWRAILSLSRCFLVYIYIYTYIYIYIYTRCSLPERVKRLSDTYRETERE